MNKQTKILVVTGSIITFLVIVMVVLAFVLHPRKDEQYTDYGETDLSQGLDSSTESTIADWEQSNEPVLLDTYSDALYGTGIMIINNSEIDEYNRYVSGNYTATDDELKQWIIEVRNYYRRLDFDGGAAALRRHENVKMPYSDYAREYLILYYDIGITSSIRRYQEDNEKQGDLFSLISRLQDAETFMLAALSCDNSYTFYLDKDAVYLSGTFGLYGQGIYLDSSSEFYDMAGDYINPTAVYRFPIRYNDSYLLDCFVVYGEGAYYILTITNPDGSKTTPYELSGGIIPEVSTEVMIPVSTEATESSAEVLDISNTEEDEETIILRNYTSYSEELIHNILQYLSAVSPSQIATVSSCSDNDCTITMKDGSTIFLTIADNRVISAQEDNQNGKILTPYDR